MTTFRADLDPNPIGLVNSQRDHDIGANPMRWANEALDMASKCGRKERGGPIEIELPWPYVDKDGKQLRVVAKQGETTKVVAKHIKEVMKSAIKQACTSPCGWMAPNRRP